MIGQRIEIWKGQEYDYPAAHGFIPIMISYVHEDGKYDVPRAAVLVVPGGGYRSVAPMEGHGVAKMFYEAGYNVFVLAYTVNPLDEAPLLYQPLADISRAVRIIRRHSVRCNINPERIVVCGFSAGGHLCGSLCVHYEDVKDPNPEYDKVSNRPDAAILAYPVITSGEFAHRDSFKALLGEYWEEQEELRDYFSLEKYVTKDTPPCFIWQTADDMTVPLENSFLFAGACRRAGVPHSYHVFTEGVHGMSIATEGWLERRDREIYTLEQIRILAEEISKGNTKFPKEMGEALLRDQGIPFPTKEKWEPEMKKRLYRIIKEVGMWTDLAFMWLESVLHLYSIEKKKRSQDMPENK